MKQDDIYVKMTKVWSRFQVGDVVRFGLNKGKSRIALGLGVEVSRQKAVNDPIVAKKPKVETATINIDAETAEVTPVKETKNKFTKTGQGKK